MCALHNMQRRTLGQEDEYFWVGLTQITHWYVLSVCGMLLTSALNSGL